MYAVDQLRQPAQTPSSSGRLPKIAGYGLNIHKFY